MPADDSKIGSLDSSKQQDPPDNKHAKRKNSVESCTEKPTDPAPDHKRQKVNDEQEHEEDEAVSDPKQPEIRTELDCNSSAAGSTVCRLQSRAGASTVSYNFLTANCSHAAGNQVQPSEVLIQSHEPIAMNTALPTGVVQKLKDFYLNFAQRPAELARLGLLIRGLVRLASKSKQDRSVLLANLAGPGPSSQQAGARPAPASAAWGKLISQLPQVIIIIHAQQNSQSTACI